MHFRIGLDKDKKNIILETDELVIENQLKGIYSDRTYSPFMKKWVTKDKKYKIFNRKKTISGYIYFEIGIGWISYILTMFKPYIFQEDYNNLLYGVYNDTYRQLPFSELRDYQNSDVLHLLKYKRGLMSVYTGYGKTFVITILAKYFLEQKKKVLLVTPQTKPRDELLKRIKSEIGIDVKKLGEGGDIQSVITSGFLNQKRMKDPVLENKLIQELETFDVVLSDEVEYCINPAGDYIFSHVKPSVMYGFSGTADKSSGKMISLANGLNEEVVARNKDLIKYFGSSLIYRQPLDREITKIHVKTPSMNPGNLKVYDISEDSGNIYLEIMTKIFTNPDVCKDIVKISRKYPLLFIPINNLHNIIYHWIDNYFIGVFRVLLVCHEGYLYYDLQGNKTSLTLQDACDKIKAGEVDVIPSTASGFRALDFPFLSNILIFSGIIGGSVLQQIGRCARQKQMNIITLEPENGKSIPVYSKGSKTREKMIQDYYKYCKIEDLVININEL